MVTPASSPAPDAAHEARERAVTLPYTNWRGEFAMREIIPMWIFFGSNEWHPEPQWLIEAWDCQIKKHRTFALAGFGQPETRAFAAAMQAREARIAELEAALRDVLDPLGRIKRRADAEGAHLSGMAYQIANSVSFLQDIARAALAAASQSEPTS